MSKYEYTFEDRIRKNKLPKGVSYVLQTTDITNVLSTEGLAVSYNYIRENPRKLEKQYCTVISLLSYTKYGRRLGECGSLLDYDRRITVYSVPAKIRKQFRFAITTNVLPILKELKGPINVSVYYRAFNKSNYKPLDRGGLYIEQERYSDKAKVLYRDDGFDIDKEIKEIVS